MTQGWAGPGQEPRGPVGVGSNPQNQAEIAASGFRPGKIAPCWRRMECGEGKGALRRRTAALSRMGAGVRGDRLCHPSWRQSFPASSRLYYGTFSNLSSS